MDVIDVPDTTVGGVLDWVDQADSPAGRLERCELAIKAEQAGKQRGTLLSSLTSLRTTLTEGPPPPPDAAPATGDPASQPSSESTSDGPAEPEAKLCDEHFPAGWRSAVITRTEAATGVRQPSVTCEHGTYTRSAE